MTRIDTDKRESTHRWARWAGLAVTLLLFLLLVAHSLWGSLAQRRLDAEVARLQAQGEPMAFEQLPVSNVLDADNASLDYQAAGKSISEQTPAWQKWSNHETGEFELPFTQDEATTLSAICAENTTALARVAAARGKQLGGWGDVFIKPYFRAILDFQSSRRLARLLEVCADENHSVGRETESIESLRDLLRLSNASTLRPTLIGHLVAMGISSMAAETTSAIAADLRIGSGGADRAKVESLLQELQNERPLLDSRRLAWRSERIFQLDATNEFVDGVLSMNLTATPTTGERLIAYAAKPLVLNDARLMMAHIQDVQKATEAPDWPSALRAFPTTFPKAVIANPTVHLAARMMLPALDRAAHSSYRAITERRLAAVALAIRLYALDHDGRLPATLDELAPRYLPAVPIDPMSAQPLRYLDDPKQPRIYSVGSDGIDDGGRPAARAMGMGTYGLKGDDVVFLTRQPRKLQSDGDANSATQP